MLTPCKICRFYLSLGIFVCATVVSYVAFVLLLFVRYLSFFWCHWKAVHFLCIFTYFFRIYAQNAVVKSDIG